MSEINLKLLNCFSDGGHYIEILEDRLHAHVLKSIRKPGVQRKLQEIYFCSLCVV